MKRIPKDIPYNRGMHSKKLRFHTNFSPKYLSIYLQIIEIFKDSGSTELLYISNRAYDRYGRRIKNSYSFWTTASFTDIHEVWVDIKYGRVSFINEYEFSV